MVSHLPMYDKIPNWNQWEILFLLISAKLRSLDPTLLYCIDSDWTTLSIGGKKWCLSEWPNLVYSMVRHLPMYDKIPNWNQWEILFLLISAKLRSLDPTLLYCINSDWTTLSIGGKKWCLSEWPNLAYWIVRHLPIYDKIPNWNQWEILFLLISAKLRSLDPTLLYCINSDWTTLSIGGKKWCLSEWPNLAYWIVRHLPIYDKIPNWNQWEILFLLISAKLRSLDPTLLYCIDSDWTTLSIGGKKWCLSEWPNLAYWMVRHLHMYDKIPNWNQWEILFLLISAKLRSLDPTLLYCINSDWTTLSIGGKKWCLSEWPNLAYWMVRHLHMYDKIPNWNQWEILFLLISAKLRSLDPTLLYCINSDWTTLSIGGKKLMSLGTTKFGVLDGKASTHVWQNPQLKLMGNTVSAHICQIKVFRPYPVILYRLRLDHSIHW